MSDEGTRDDDVAPASPGVKGEHPNRFQEGGAEPLDEAPDGKTPSDPTESAEDSLPPGADLAEE